MLLAVLLLISTAAVLSVPQRLQSLDQDIFLRIPPNISASALSPRIMAKVHAHLARALEVMTGAQTAQLLVPQRVESRRVVDDRIVRHGAATEPLGRSQAQTESRVERHGARAMAMDEYRRDTETMASRSAVIVVDNDGAAALTVSQTAVYLRVCTC